MKKALSFALAAIMGVSVFTACAPAADRLDPAITLASSDAYANAEHVEEYYNDWVTG